MTSIIAPCWSEGGEKGKSFLSQISPSVSLFPLISLSPRAALSAYSVHNISSFSPHNNLQRRCYISPILHMTKLRLNQGTCYQYINSLISIHELLVGARSCEYPVNKTDIIPALLGQWV